MRVLISFDMEGVAGIVDWDQCRAGGHGYEIGCRLLLGEVNAAIEGALAGGAEEIVCNDSHGLMHNLPADELVPPATYVAGRHKPLYMMQGMQGDTDAVLLVGYHGAISGPSAILSHTYNPGVVSGAWLNGIEVGEGGINALVALAYRSPIALVTGDAEAVAELEPWSPKAERVIVKDSVSRFSAASIHPELARQRIAEAARAAVERAGEIGPPCIDLPARLEVEVQTADMAEVATWAKGVERAGLRRVQIESADPLAVFRSFVAMIYITRVAEGR